MNELERIFIFEEKGKSFTNSLNVAEIFKKSHKNVLQAIQNLECSDEFRRLNFQPSTYLNSQNKEMPMFNITKNGFAFLGFSFTGKEAAQFKEIYIMKFDEMEETIKKQAIQIQGLKKTLLEIGGEEGFKLLEKEQSESLQVLHGFPFHDPDYISQYEFQKETGHISNKFIYMLEEDGYVERKLKQYYDNMAEPKYRRYNYLFVPSEKCNDGMVHHTKNELARKADINENGFSYRVKRSLVNEWIDQWNEMISQESRKIRNVALCSPKLT